MPPIPKKPAANAPSVRLALGAEVCKTVGPKALGPTVRLATTPDGAKTTGTYEKSINPPTVRLAHVPGAQGDNNLLGRNGVERLPDLSAPALLVSYYYLEAFLKNKHRYQYRDWMMDSGAFSAYNSGKVIDIDAYIACCHELRESDPTLSEIIALDVIGDGRASLKNAEYMRKKGVDVVPVFHIGEDWGLLKEYCRGWDKVGISCRFGEPIKKSYWFYEQCFAREWPKKFHSFGWLDEKMMMRFPLHSGDSCSWEIGPCGFGNWKFFGKMTVRGSSQNLRSQVDWYLRFEERLRERWKKEMAQLEALPDASSVRPVRPAASGLTEKQIPPTVRLVGTRGGGGQERIDSGIEKRGGAAADDKAGG